MDGSGKRKEEVDAREQSQSEDGQDLVSAWRWEERKKEESDLMETLCWVMPPMEKGSQEGKLVWGKNLILYMLNLR